MRGDATAETRKKDFDNVQNVAGGTSSEPGIVEQSGPKDWQVRDSWSTDWSEAGFNRLPWR